MFGSNQRRFTCIMGAMGFLVGKEMVFRSGHVRQMVSPQRVSICGHYVDFLVKKSLITTTLYGSEGFLYNKRLCNTDKSLVNFLTGGMRCPPQPAS